MLNSNSLKVNNKNGVVFLTFPKIEAAGGAVHGFSTRIGGVSEGIYSSMSFSQSIGDNPSAVRENFNRFAKSIGADPSGITLSDQTHTANVRVITKEDIGKGLHKTRDYTDIDGLVTNVPGAVLVTQYADCTPLAFYGEVPWRKLPKTR